MEISGTEISANSLNIGYDNCNALFTHVNTMPPEYRPSKLKNIHKKEVDESTMSQIQQLALQFNPNDERNHIIPNWRKFTLQQIKHAKEYYQSKLELKGSIEMHDIRPPELLIFNNLLIFNKYLKISPTKSKKP